MDEVAREATAGADLSTEESRNTLARAQERNGTKIGSFRDDLVKEMVI